MSTNQREYTKVFLKTYGSGPWECVACHNLIFELGRKIGLGNIHHHNHNHFDNRPENLEPLHHQCHAHKHMKGSVSGEKNGFFGRHHSEETRKIIGIKSKQYHQRKRKVS
jgi:hypothetical protein